MPSNRGLASHLAVSPVSDSSELVAGFSATPESNVLITNSCRSSTAAPLATPTPRFCDAGATPAGHIHVPDVSARSPSPVFAEADVEQTDVPRCRDGAATRTGPIRSGREHHE